MILLESVATERNIFHFTTGGDNEKHGDRSPIIYTKANRLYFQFLNHRPQMVQKYDHEIPFNKTVHVKMYHSFGADYEESSHVRIFIGGKKVMFKRHKWKVPLQNVKCYFGSPWYDPSPVRITNLRYTQNLIYPGTFHQD